MQQYQNYWTLVPVYSLFIHFLTPLIPVLCPFVLFPSALAAPFIVLGKVLEKSSGLWVQ